MPTRRKIISASSRRDRITSRRLLARASGRSRGSARARAPFGVLASRRICVMARHLLGRRLANSRPPTGRCALSARGARGASSAARVALAGARGQRLGAPLPRAALRAVDDGDAALRDSARAPRRPDGRSGCGSRPGPPRCAAARRRGRRAVDEVRLPWCGTSSTSLRSASAVRAPARPPARARCRRSAARCAPAARRRAARTTWRWACVARA